VCPCGFDVLLVCGRFEFANGRVVAESCAAVGVVVGGVPAATVESADAGNADGDYGDCGLDSGPDCDVYYVVCCDDGLVGFSLFGIVKQESGLWGCDLQVKSAIFSATRRTISKTRVMIPRANIVIAPVFNLLLS
jgi:hypothetical protein